MAQCTAWTEFTAITSCIDKKLREKSWDVLSESEQARLLDMNPTKIKVGDKVDWINHYPHLSSWMPLQVEQIDSKGQVKLELCDFLVPIEELSLAL